MAAANFTVMTAGHGNWLMTLVHTIRAVDALTASDAFAVGIAVNFTDGMELPGRKRQIWGNIIYDVKMITSPMAGCWQH